MTKADKLHYGFNWHDLMTPDVDAAKAFYGHVVGWRFGTQGDAYHTLLVGDKAVGGLMATPPHLLGMAPFWSGYIAVSDVDKMCGAILEAGGSVHRAAWDIPDLLRMAVVADASGAVFNIYHPLGGGEMQSPPAGAPGTVGWNENFTDDLTGAVDFYNRLFGWTRGVGHDMGSDMGVYQLMQVNGADHAGIMKRPGHIPQACWGFYFTVDGIDAALARLAEKGGKLTNGPMQVPDGQWVANAQDPQGAHFSLVSRTK